ncbi:MAG TPA: CarD family transcriptional regulator [Acetobacteraceae bacterium]|nr:CarD family transcriptional regulator [Acetobacteraceae bacterium]
MKASTASSARTAPAAKAAHKAPANTRVARAPTTKSSAKPAPNAKPAAVKSRAAKKVATKVSLPKKAVAKPIARKPALAASAKAAATKPTSKSVIKSAAPKTPAKMPSPSVTSAPVPQILKPEPPPAAKPAPAQPEAMKVEKINAEIQRPAPASSSPDPIVVPRLVATPMAAPPKPAAAAPPPASSVHSASPVHSGMSGAPVLHVRQPAAKDEIFVEGDYVVYPTHGVGKVEKIAVEDIAGHRLELIHITFDENRMTLRVPVAKARSAGLRKLATRKMFDDAMAVLRGKARIKRTMWSRRAQEYEAKINSGDPLTIAEVVRDLHRNAGQPDQSFSERQIYEAAMDRLAAELAALDQTDKGTAAAKLQSFLKTLT